MDAASSTLIFYGVFLGALYLFFIRPRKLQNQKMKEMLSTLKVGDTIVTHGGIVGTILEVFDEEIVINTGDRVSIKLKRWAVGAIEDKK